MTLFKSSADRLFVEQLAEVNNKGNINVPHKRHFVLWGESTDDRNSHIKTTSSLAPDPYNEVGVTAFTIWAAQGSKNVFTGVHFATSNNMYILSGSLYLSPMHRFNFTSDPNIWFQMSSGATLPVVVRNEELYQGTRWWCHNLGDVIIKPWRNTHNNTTQNITGSDADWHKWKYLINSVKLPYTS